MGFIGSIKGAGKTYLEFMVRILQKLVGFLLLIAGLIQALKGVHKRGKVEDLFDHIKAIKLDTSALDYLKDTDFVVIFFYKTAHIEADYIVEAVRRATEKLDKLFPRMSLDIINSDEEYELSHHYEIVMHCKLFIKFEDTTTYEYPSRIFKDHLIIQWIFETVRKQTRARLGMPGVDEVSLQRGAGKDVGLDGWGIEDGFEEFFESVVL